jgi:hypothetical protein
MERRDIYQGLPHFGFIVHESKSEKMAIKKAATAATLTAVFAVEDDS